MGLPPLTIIPAGAGSGKTYSIQTTLARWINAKEVEPDRIVAVTFTEAAAAELRGRIRDELVCNNFHAEALKLDQAYISTIHGFGLRLLSEFAFDAGLNPAPRLLSEDEEKVLVRLALAANDKSISITKDLNRFGYKYNHNDGSTPEDKFRATILALMAKLRSIGQLQLNSESSKSVLENISKLYGPVKKNADYLQQTLIQAIQNLLAVYPGDISHLCKTKGVAKEVNNNFKLLQKAIQNNALDNDWQLWQKLRGLKQSTPRNPLPAEYDQLIQGVIDAAGQLLEHPGPLRDALDHVRTLLDTAQSSLADYADLKTQRGLLDYTDMLTLTHRMLSRHPEILELLRQRFQCLVIDEFQDTNPLQFALLWAFREAGIPTLVVGDVKQAIMRFQNADARLLQELQLQEANSCRPLTGNWRTHKNLMNWVNDIGSGLFDDHYTTLEPKADFSSSLTSLELVDFGQQGNAKTRAEHTVARIKDLLEDEDCRVFDRHSAQIRHIRGGDIALICPKNKTLQEYASAFRAVGIRSRISEDGWFSDRIVQLLYYAICFVADPTDQHASLYLAVTELGDMKMASALKMILQGQELNCPVLDILRPIRENYSDQLPLEIINQIIAGLDLFGFSAEIQDAAQARANLLRFQAEAAEFEEANREALATLGYYGNELKTFLAWLRDRVERLDEKPQPRVQDEDAVELVTWHRSKGREWPIVVVAATDSNIVNRLPDIDVGYDDFKDLGRILDKARLEISPAYAVPEKNDVILSRLWNRAEDSACRLLYVALTRAREKIILEWPSYLDNGKERKTITYWELLCQRTGLSYAGNKISIKGRDYDCRVTKADKNHPKIFAEDFPELSNSFNPIGRRAIKNKPLPDNLTPETVRPSVHEIDHATGKINIQTFNYASPIVLDFELPADVLGTLMHRCFEVIGDSCTQDFLEKATGFKFTPDQIETIHTHAMTFNKWVDSFFNPVNLLREVPIIALDEQGSVINGFIDMLVDTDTGLWIIDHKSDQTDDLDTRFNEHLPQLLSYKNALARTRTDKPVIGLAINWIRRGTISIENIMK
ncbi:MAG: UvrD-helicase domain-containing protein [Deltaproteobacteria bacterium]|nr:UvrD-helicase domain-containing protein [Deltaproteobacteria bacterium]